MLNMYIIDYSRTTFPLNDQSTNVTVDTGIDETTPAQIVNV